MAVELQAHELGRPLCREVQQRHPATILNHQVRRTRCPACRTDSELKPDHRQTASIDVTLSLPKRKGCARNAAGRKRWRLRNGSSRHQAVTQGAKFVPGIEVKDAA